MTNQSGFTLIELVMVIVIIAVLAAVGLPKQLDIKSDAQQAAVNSVAGSLGVASATNAAARQANVVNGVAVTNCTDVANALNGGLPNGYDITPGGVTAGSSATCTVTRDDGPQTASFVAQGID